MTKQPKQPEVVNDLTGDSIKAFRLPDGRYVTEKLAKEIEEPVSEGLEEEIANWMSTHLYGKDDKDYDAIRLWGEYVARHFAQWGAEHLADDRKMSPNSLQEYASRAGFDYVDNIVQEHPGHRFNDHDVEFAYRDGIIAGAKWDRSQMMEEAEEYEVGMHGEPIKITIDKYVQRAKGIFPGDKVKIIIVKED